MAAATATRVSTNCMGRLQRDAAPIAAANAVLYPGNKYKDRLACARRLVAQERCAVRILVCIDGEAVGRLSALSDVPHRHIGAFDMAPGSIRIEQWRSLAIAVELFS